MHHRNIFYFSNWIPVFVGTLVYIQSGFILQSFYLHSYFYIFLSIFFFQSKSTLLIP
jgi:hypothetical protein